MFKKNISLLKTILKVSVSMFILCGLLYPLIMTGVSQIVFPAKANGSIIYEDGKAIGSALIGQDFTDPRFMVCRPSAVNYNTYTEQDVADGSYGGVATGSQNFAPSNPKLVERANADIEEFLAANPGVKKGDIPADLLTASGSGLDPHISPMSARLQIPRLSLNTGIAEEVIDTIIKNNSKRKVLGVFGAETVNVLGVNLEIAKMLKIIG